MGDSREESNTLKGFVLFISLILPFIPSICPAENSEAAQGERSFIYSFGRSTRLILASDGGWFIQYYPEAALQSERPGATGEIEDSGWRTQYRDLPGTERSTILRINDRGYSLIWNASPHIDRYESISHEPEYMIMHR